MCAAFVVTLVIATAGALPLALTTSARASGAAPVVTSLSPATGVQGQFVAIAGSGFTGASAVHFGGAATFFHVQSDALIAAMAPPLGPGTVDVTVTTPGGTSAVTGDDRFTYPVTTVPVVTGIRPFAGAPGQFVTVTGTGFTGTLEVRFGSAPTFFGVRSGTVMSVMVPPGERGLVSVTVATPAGRSAPNLPATFVALPPVAPMLPGFSGVLMCGRVAVLERLGTSSEAFRLLGAGLLSLGAVATFERCPAP